MSLQSEGLWVHVISFEQLSLWQREETAHSSQRRPPQRWYFFSSNFKLSLMKQKLAVECLKEPSLQNFTVLSVSWPRFASAKMTPKFPVTPLASQTDPSFSAVRKSRRRRRSVCFGHTWHLQWFWRWVFIASCNNGPPQDQCREKNQYVCGLLQFHLSGRCIAPIHPMLSEDSQITTRAFSSMSLYVSLFIWCSASDVHIGEIPPEKRVKFL